MVYKEEDRLREALEEIKTFEGGGEVAMRMVMEIVHKTLDGGTCGV